jgi:hypothetical protein
LHLLPSVEAPDAPHVSHFFVTHTFEAPGQSSAEASHPQCS